MNLLLALVSVFSINTAATKALAYNSEDSLGEEIVSFSSPHQKKEICVRAHKLPNSQFSEADLQSEQQLCRFDLYGLTSNTKRVAVCPKISSTNPGINLLVDKSNLQFPSFSVNCQKKDERLTLIAKYKQSISCSYTPSILMYYHLSRRFGGILNIPVSVLRTVDKEAHYRWTEEALSYFGPLNQELIHQTWKQYAKAHQSPAKYPRLFTEDQKYIYGAILFNTNGEQYYSEVNGRGDYDTRELRFQQQPPFLKVASSQSIDQLNEGLSLHEKIQNIVQMQDISNMVLFDYLLNQQDRIGNIHYLEYYYSIENNNVRVEREPFSGSNPIKQMILKDNDCGIAKENRFKAFGVLEKIRHMTPKTYKTLMVWANEIRQPETAQFLQKELLLTKQDLFDTDKGLINNALAAKRILQKNCRSGALKLDLSLRDLNKPYVFDPKDCEDL
ncbi:MAG: hypothetical protein RJB66_2696 [Pseudomonadota bacterium]|jgi:hypothetical protein